jgi:steroid 5-alpha reductase family enzyme
MTMCTTPLIPRRKLTFLLLSSNWSSKITTNLILHRMKTSELGLDFRYSESKRYFQCNSLLISTFHTVLSTKW